MLEEKRKNKTKPRALPRISVNKLAEYLTTSNAARRQRILYDQKYPSDYIVTHYHFAKSIILDYFAQQNISVLKNGIELALQKKCDECEIQALQSVMDISIPKFTDITFELWGNTNTASNIEGTKISIQPDLLIRGNVKNKPFVGAIKIHLSQSNPLKEEAREYVALVLHDSLKQSYPNEEVKLEYCLCIDVFLKELSYTPKAYKKRLENVEAGCKEIATIWNSIEKK